MSKIFFVKNISGLFLKTEPQSQFKMELPAWQTGTQIILIFLMLLLVWVLKNRVRTIRINPNRTIVEVELEIPEDTSSLGTRLQGLEVQIQAIETNHVELDKRIQSIKEEVEKTTRAGLGEKKVILNTDYEFYDCVD